MSVELVFGTERLMLRAGILPRGGLGESELSSSARSEVASSMTWLASGTSCLLKFVLVFGSNIFLIKVCFDSPMYRATA